MPNTSASGGYVLPHGAAPAQDLALAAVFQLLISGVTGIAGSLVRPRWQPQPPNMPANNVDWAAFGVTSQEGDTQPYVAHDGRGDGQDIVQRNELVEVLISFYGPNAGGNAGLLRDGLAIAQNREDFQRNGIGLVDFGPTRAVPTMVNSQWENRIDVPITVRREILRAYPILNILSAVGSITSEITTTTVVTDFNVQQ